MQLLAGTLRAPGELEYLIMRQVQLAIIILKWIALSVAHKCLMADSSEVIALLRPLGWTGLI